MPDPDPPLPPGCTLRRGAEADLPTIRALVRSARLDPTQLRPAQFWVIEHEGSVVACGQLRRFPGAQELGSLVVAPAWRDRGLAAFLIHHLIATATEPLYLECRAGLIPFYQQYGFQVVAWRDLPGALKLKFGLSKVFGAIFRVGVGSMEYRGAP